MTSNNFPFSQFRHVLYGTLTTLVLMGTVLGLYIINSPQGSPDNHQLSTSESKSQQSTSLALVAE